MDTVIPHVETANRACSLLYSYIKEHSSGVWILPVNVCPDVPLTFFLAGVSFEFVDIEPDTLCLDIKEVLKLIEEEPSRYRGVLYVRTYGFLYNTDKIFSSIKSINKRILIIDDRCLCVPERCPNLWGADMLLYSTGHCKPIDFGEGGMAFYNTTSKYNIDKDLHFNGTDEETIYKEAYKLGEPLKQIPTGWLKMEDYIDSATYMERIEEAILVRVKKRNEINSIYSKFLPSSIQMSPCFQLWRFNIRVKPSQKETILNKLFENGLFASSHYHSVNRLFNTTAYPISDSLYECIINLFNDQYYSTEKALKTCNIINGIIK